MIDYDAIALYEFTDIPGGEHYWLKRISERLKVDIQFFWDNRANKPFLKPSGFLNFLIYLFTRTASHFSPEFARGIYSLFGTYTYRIKTSGPNIVSSSFIPLPIGKELITYVHTPSRLLTIYSERELKLRGKRTMSGAYFRIWRMMYYFLYKSSFSRARLIIANSYNTHNRLKHYFNIDSIIMNPSVDIENFYCGEFKNYFFYPSRITSSKRQLFVLEAFFEFYCRNKEFKLILASTSSNSMENRKYLLEVETYIQTHQLPVEIRWDLNRKELIDIYANSYICLFAGEDEDFGQIPIESMASCKPIISVKEGGPMETIKDGVTGYLVSDEHEMAERMLELSGNLSKVKEMGLKGRKHVESTFSDEKFVSDLLKLINGVT